MNRRELLHTLSVLSAGGAWAFMSGSLPAGEMIESNPVRNDSLLRVLAESAAQCDQMLASYQPMPQSQNSVPVKALEELSCLIDEARLRLLKQRSDSPAFWQACGDAFLRAAESIATGPGPQPVQHGDLQQAERTFRRTAQLVIFEISGTTRRNVS